jgi:hypothetical protein
MKTVWMLICWGTALFVSSLLIVWARSSGRCFLSSTCLSCKDPISLEGRCGVSSGSLLS